MADEPNKTPVKHEFTLSDGKKIELTDEELKKAAEIGLEKSYQDYLAEENKKKQPEKKEEPKKELSDDEKWLKEERARIEAERVQKAAIEKDLAILNGIEKMVKEDTELEGWHDEVIAALIGKANLNKLKSNNTDGGQLDIKALFEDVRKTFKEKIAKNKPKLNAEKKLKDAEKTALTTSGKSGNIVEPKKYQNKDAFRDPKFHSHISGRVKQLIEEATE